MQSSIWNTITKFSSLLAVIFLLLGAVLIGGSFFGSADNQSADGVVIFCAVGLAIFSLAALHLIKFQTARRTQTNERNRRTNFVGRKFRQHRRQ